MHRRYKVVDVFTDRPLLGNPVAVVLDAQGLDTPAMRRIAQWTNLSETTFLKPPTRAGADYALRIFTPGGELPFAGHPTLGSAHAAIEAGILAPREGRLVQECGVGLVGLAVDAGGGGARRLTLDLPPAKLRTLDPSDVAELEAALGAPVDRGSAPAAVDVGPVWIVARLADAAAVLALKPDFAKVSAFDRRFGASGVTVFGGHPPGAEAAIEVRSFAPSSGVAEDPVCGSGNGSVAVFRRERGLLPPGGARYVASQGRCVGSDGRIAVAVGADGAVTLGGACVTCIDGMLAV